VALSENPTALQPLSEAARFYAGPTLARLLEAGQLVSALGIAFGQVVTTPHYLAALGTPDGLGTWLGKVRESGAPIRALVVSALFVSIVVSAGELQTLFVLSSIAVLSQYCVAALSLIWLVRRKAIATQRGHIPWAACALVTSLLLASYATRAELLTTFLVVMVGVALLVARRTLLQRSA